MKQIRVEEERYYAMLAHFINNDLGISINKRIYFIYIVVGILCERFFVQIWHAKRILRIIFMRPHDLGNVLQKTQFACTLKKF